MPSIQKEGEINNYNRDLNTLEDLEAPVTKFCLFGFVITLSFFHRMQHQVSLHPPGSQQVRALCHAALPSLRHQATPDAESPSSICAHFRAP